MAELHARLRAFLRHRRIQLNVVASNPRQGGTMLLIALGCAHLAEGHQAIGLVNEPGNLGVLPGCRHDQADNPRRDVDMQRLLLITAQLAWLQWRLQQQMRTGGCEVGWIERQRELAQRLCQPRIHDAEGRYDPGFDTRLLADVEALLQSLDGEDGSHRIPATEQPPLILTVKEHTYNRNEAEFLRLLALVQESGGSLLFTTRRPSDCFHSFLLRRTVHFLSAAGTITNREIAAVVRRLLPAGPEAADPGPALEDLERWATAGFSSSGDRIDRQRLLAFVGKAPGDSIAAADLQQAGQRIWAHGLDIIQISYANTERYLRLARERLPASTHLVDFDALLEQPDTTLSALARRIPWIQAFRSRDWDPECLRNVVNIPEAFVLPGSEIERNVWFKDTLSATGIRPRTDRQTGLELLQVLNPQAAAALEHAHQAVLALG
jgi:hypothetical protein